jgi:hypothetical protein
MKEKIEYTVVFSAVEKAVDMNSPMLQCSECGKGFYKITMVDMDQPDFILIDDQYFRCDDHVLYDLIIDPEVTTTILIGQTKYKGTSKTQVHIRKVDAQIFIPNRNN